MTRKLVALSVLLVGAIAVIAFYASPWPSVLVIRSVFDQGARRASEALRPLVPQSVVVESGLTYDPGDRDAQLDVYRGAAAMQDRPLIVWFHGGGFVSGRRADVSNYLRILAGQGFTVVNVDYTIAPEATYPEPIRQANKALAYLAANSSKLRINANKIVVAGDSAGAQIAAQTAAMLTNHAYARALGIAPGISANRLVGALLYCGVYDITEMGKGGGVLGWFVKSATWAYSGERDWRNARGFKTMSITPYITATFPPTFISAGNGDPLGPQSVALAKSLEERHVNVTTVFYPVGYHPSLGHEYQFKLDIEAGKHLLDRSVSWLRTL